MADPFGASPSIETDFSIWQTESFHRKELAKWNAPKRLGGYNTNGGEEFPKMLYMARQHPKTRKWLVALSEDETTMVGMQEKVTLDAQAFTRTCQLTVYSQEEQDKAIRAGWALSQKLALEKHETDVEDAARAAAERNWQDRNMSPAAKAESDAFEKTTPDHVAAIPEQPVRRKGWPKGKKRGPKVQKIADLTQS